MSLAHPRIATLRVGGRGAPRHVADAAPRVTWTVETTAPGWLQASASLELRRPDGRIEHAELPDGRSALVAWPFSPLGAYDAAQLRVTVTGQDGERIGPSGWLSVETGPLSGADWHAPFIAAADDLSDGEDADVSVARGASGPDVRADLLEEDADRRVSRFRREFAVPSPIVRALLSYTAHGIVEMLIDGHVVVDDQLAPGWTSYADRLLFRTVDVTDRLGAGEHVLGAQVGPGWHAEHFGFDGDFRRTWHGRRALSAQLRLEYADGRHETLVTDDRWDATIAGPTRFASIYQGERYDARLADDGLQPGAALPAASRAVVVGADPSRLRPAGLPPVRVTETRTVEAVIPDASGAPILDFGQNLVGRLRLRLRGAAGTEVAIRHAEVLEDGRLGVRPLRFAAATDRYVLRGDPDGEEWAPRFTFHGFRYAQITGLDADSVDAVAEVLHTDLQRTGWLATGVPALDRLHENVVWGARGNFVSIPTDCPQRDERLGWTGDIQVFAPTAGYLFDTNAFLSSWLEDLAADQARIGGVGPLYVPLIDQDLFPPTPIAAWGDAATIVPWSMWQQFADDATVERQYESMRAWVDVVHEQAPDGLWEEGMQLGDWLDPSAPPDRPFEAQTDPHLVATAYLFHSASLVAEAAVLLGRSEDASAYGELAARVRDAFLDRYVDGEGRMTSDSQTAYALAIVFGLLPDGLVPAAGHRLAAIVERGAHRIGTGFVGTPIVCDALTLSGHRATAQRMLQTDEAPSWLYPVSMGATTVWERWDSMLPDGTINPGDMTSFNHYALGAVADWLHRDVGGIAPLAPGYRRVLVRPRAGLTSAASARYDSVHGTFRVEWEAIEPAAGELSALRATVTVPPNTTAVIDLPGSDPVEVGSGTHRFGA
ncbi:alpha-L-rhamnosidase [Microbacterium marinilacus]|uniref:alpha-L-rhamnosidase n=1 Tax=Microbacterium marinilacus TaxID=415209 RepID=A0ABP7B9Z8_9MICO|nr:alpha-L-rhamnosidase [Microbacterium marinilacus]MBY0687290.1 glycoside hydrolase family 78 protein [Microbacterium marinilacus]